MNIWWKNRQKIATHKRDRWVREEQKTSPVGDYRDVSSISEFYHRLGLLARLETGEIPSVSQLHMEPADHEALEQMILKEL